MRNIKDRQRAEKAGRRAEFLAGLVLRLKGYSILAQRFKSPAGEIDLIAKRGRLIAYVEVKARSSIEEALHAVTAQARRRISAAVGSYLARKPGLAEHDMRYDIIAVCGWRVHHIQDAWREGD